jgi:hypothetical protein
MLFPAVRSGECCALLVSTKVSNPQSNCFVPMTPIGPRKHPAMPSKTSVGKICCPICHCPRMPLAYSRTDKKILDSTLNTRPCLTSCLDFKVHSPNDVPPFDLYSEAPWSSNALNRDGHLYKNANCLASSVPEPYAKSLCGGATSGISIPQHVYKITSQHFPLQIIL